LREKRPTVTRSPVIRKSDPNRHRNDAGVATVALGEAQRTTGPAIRPQIDVAAMVIREAGGTATIRTPTPWCSLVRTLTAAAPVRTVEADDTTVINPSVVMALE